MTAKNITLKAIGNLTEATQQWFTHGDVLAVVTTRDLQTTVTNVAIPAGTMGRVLSQDGETLIIDFGIVSVQRVPVDSDKIRIEVTK